MRSWGAAWRDRPARRAVPDRVRRDGYTTLSLFDAVTCDVLADLVLAAMPDPAPEFFASPAHGWGDLAEALHLDVLDVVGPQLRRDFPEHRVFMVAATVKGPTGGMVKYHQDWTYTDERYHRPLFLWCPLVDVDEASGVLRMVPGSHRGAERTVRASVGMHGRHVTEPYQAVLDECATGRPMRAGEAIAFEPATIHGSGPNTTGQVRPAITIALVPHGATLVHFHAGAEGLSGHLVDDGFFTRHDYATRPSGPSTVTPWAPCITDGDIAALVRRLVRAGGGTCAG